MLIAVICWNDLSPQQPWCWQLWQQHQDEQPWRVETFLTSLRWGSLMKICTRCCFDNIFPSINISTKSKPPFILSPKLPVVFEDFYWRGRGGGASTASAALHSFRFFIRKLFWNLFGSARFDALPAGWEAGVQPRLTKSHSVYRLYMKNTGSANWLRKTSTNEH